MHSIGRFGGVGLGLLLLALGAPPEGTFAADYPAKPVRLVVPFPPGGALDILARGLAPSLGAQLRQEVVVDNRPGANGVIAFDLVAKAPADGYTLLMAFAAGMAAHPLLVPKLPYDPAKDFAPVGMLARGPMVLIANPSFSASSVQEVIALAKTAPGTITYGSAGTGSPTHLAGESFKSMAGIDLVHAPYRGGGPVITDVISGHIPIAFVTLPTALPQVRAGKVKALAITSNRRSDAAPDLPTMAEAGLPGLVIIDWAGILAPAGTPSARISRLNEEIAKAVRSPEIHRHWIEQGFEPNAMAPNEFAAVIRSDVDRWGNIIRQAGIRTE